MKKPVMVVMGVSGCGKTTIGEKLSKKLKLPFFDADDFHPKENVHKMKNGLPLNNEDRFPWLKILANNIQKWGENDGAIIACSALKEKYREILVSKSKNIVWIYLSGDQNLIRARIEQRQGHYMNSILLASQFKDLEIPEYGIHIDISQSPEKIITEILLNLEHINKSFFGVIGLGVMGRSLSLNIAEKGYVLSVYNRATVGEENSVKDFLCTIEDNMRIKGFTELCEFVNSLERPRKILIMIKAGDAIDYVIESLIPMLSEGDIIIDGGNSHYQDTKKRADYLESKGLNFIGVGVSGGEEGARKGPSIMPGGNKTSYQIIAPVLESIAAIDADGKKCCAYIGPEGSGHFVKMIHNGIEYAEMQLLAEMYTLLSVSKSNEEIKEIFLEWNSGDLASYLLEITADIMTKKEGDLYVLDLILDKAGNKGTGSWSTKTAFDLGTVNTMMSSAVFARYVSVFKETRKNLAKEINNTIGVKSELSINDVKEAYRCARIINYQQGFAVIRQASESYNWNLSLSDLSRIWTNGCIIRSELMINCISYFKAYDDLFKHLEIFEVLKRGENAVKSVLIYGLNNRLPLPVFTEANTYWVSMTTERLSANMIQAQRDYFGAHTYQRIDALENQFFHTNWYEL